MSSVKLDTDKKVPDNVSDQNTSGKLPEVRIDSVREELKRTVTETTSADSIEIVAGETRLNPEQLMKMYMLGKLTTGQLAFELRKYNDVVADTIIKDGKQNFTKVIDYKGVSRASVSNPGADLTPSKDDQQTAAPKDAKDAKKEAGDTDNDKKKQELEKKETDLKAKESLQQVRVLNAFTKTQDEQKAAHLDRDLKKKTEEKEEEKLQQQLNPDEDSVGKIMNKGTLRDRLRKSVSDDIRQELEKSKSGPTQGSR